MCRCIHKSVVSLLKGITATDARGVVRHQRQTSTSKRQRQYMWPKIDELYLQTNLTRTSDTLKIEIWLVYFNLPCWKALNSKQKL